MIELPKKQEQTVKKQTVIEKPKIPFNLEDSAEVDFIKNKIKSNIAYLEKCSNKSLYKKVEADTIYLQNEILPILQAKTNLFYNDLTKKFISYLNSAIENNSNAIAIYLPINENYQDAPRIAIGNFRQNKKFGTAGAVDIFIDIINMDGNEVKFDAVYLENTK